ncbi:MAG: hypothetical protein P8O70_08275 [SAR324 cluster bacterium]|nr:hypothetical protein [SAR324 cluster bacterium]
MKFTNLRAWFGLFNLIFWVGLACVGLFNEWPSSAFPAEPASLLVEVQWWALIVIAYVLIMLPLDLLGGYVIPGLAQNIQRNFSLFWSRLLRGILVHAGILLISGLLIMEIGKLYGTWGVMGLLICMSLIMLLLQAPLARWLVGYKLHSEDRENLRNRIGELLSRRTDVVREENPIFAGGITGLPWIEKTIIPSRWLEMSEDQLRAQILRRVGAVRTHSRHRGVLVAIIWNLYGFWSASLFAGAGVETVRGLFLTSMAFVIWMCFGQIILPNFSKSGSTEADKYATTNGVAEMDLRDALQQQVQWSRDGHSEMNLIERLLSPSLPLNQRLEAIRLDSVGLPGAWDSARIAQFLSWSCLGWFSRADYNLCGQPQNWVLQSGD